MKAYRPRKPKNARAKIIAERTLEAVARMAKEQYENAIYVNGIPCVLYIPLSHGRECTCNRLAMNQRMLDALHVIQETDNVTIKPFDNPPEDLQFANLTENLVEQILEPMENSAGCACCFGVGYIGGFSAYGRERIVIDSSWPFSGSGEIIKSESPHRIFAHGRLTWDVILPRGAISVESLRIFDNQTIVQANWSVDNQQVDEKSFLSFCDGYEHTISLTPIDKTLQFSHLEIQLVLSDYELRIDFPRFDEELSLQVFEEIIGNQLIIPPTVGQVKRYSAVRDACFNKVWKITSVRKMVDHNHHIHGWECTGRMVQPMEILNLLPTLKEKSARIQQMALKYEHRQSIIL